LPWEIPAAARLPALRAPKAMNFSKNDPGSLLAAEAVCPGGLTRTSTFLFSGVDVAEPESVSSSKHYIFRTSTSESCFLLTPSILDVRADFAIDQRLA